MWLQQHYPFVHSQAQFWGININIPEQMLEHIVHWVRQLMFRKFNYFTFDIRDGAEAKLQNVTTGHWGEGPFGPVPDDWFMEMDKRRQLQSGRIYHPWSSSMLPQMCPVPDVAPTAYDWQRLNAGFLSIKMTEK